jgi:5-methylcytosine-specific restriction endonuclease McrA
MRTVLVIDVTSVPIKVVSRNRAIKLILGGKADSVADRTNILRSEDFEMFEPAVIMLRTRPNRPYKRTPPPTRRGVLARDNYTCAYCGKQGGDMTIDHVHPTSKGGEHSWKNLLCSCKPCNSKKSNRSLSDMGWSMPFEPKAPNAGFWVVLATKTKDIDPLWAPFLTS